MVRSTKSLHQGHCSFRRIVVLKGHLPKYLTAVALTQLQTRSTEGETVCMVLKVGAVICAHPANLDGLSTPREWRRSDGENRVYTFYPGLLSHPAQIC